MRSVAVAIMMWAAAGAASGNAMTVLDAYYGVGSNSCNASRAASDRCAGRDFCEVRADNQLCGDPARGQKKELVINYSCGDGVRSILVREGEIARAYCRAGYGGGSNFGTARPSTRPAKNALSISHAYYGAGNRTCDATRVLLDACEGRAECTVEVSNRLCGDPARGTRKGIDVRYSCNGRVETRNASENQRLVLRCPDYR